MLAKYPMFTILLLLASGIVKGNQDSIRTGKIRQFKRIEIIRGNIGDVFAFMDNIENTGMHMTENNAPMMGSKLQVEWLTDHKTGLDSKYRWRGKIIGMKMDFTVGVTKWIQGKEKEWESIGEAKMIVLSWYKLYLILTPVENALTKAELGIFYTKPKGSILGFFLSRRYAVWCVKSMLRDTKKYFYEVERKKNN